MVGAEVAECGMALNEMLILVSFAFFPFPNSTGDLGCRQRRRHHPDDHRSHAGGPRVHVGRSVPLVVRPIADAMRTIGAGCRVDYVLSDE